MTIKLIFISFLYLLSSPSFSEQIWCPDTPIKFNIGDKNNSGWFFWPDGELLTVMNKAKYKLLKESYSFNHWSAFPVGTIESKSKVENNIVGCCGWVSSKNKLICAYKEVASKKCQPIIKSGQKDKFICHD